MQLKFMATGQHFDYTISEHTINGTDLSEVQDSETFDLPELQAVGIRKVERVDGELRVTLQQKGIAYCVPVYSHDWRESGWIDAADYDPNTCYIVPTAAPEGTVTQWHSGTETLPDESTRTIEGWTVVEAGQ